MAGEAALMGRKAGELSPERLGRMIGIEERREEKRRDEERRGEERGGEERGGEERR